MVDCVSCYYYELLTIANSPLDREDVELIEACQLHHEIKEDCEDYKPLSGLKRLKKMRNDNFETILRSRDAQKELVLSTVRIDCKEYETFKKIVDAVMPILRYEDYDYD